MIGIWLVVVVVSVVVVAIENGDVDMLAAAMLIRRFIHVDCDVVVVAIRPDRMTIFFPKVWEVESDDDIDDDDGDDNSDKEEEQEKGVEVDKAKRRPCPQCFICRNVVLTVPIRAAEGDSIILKERSSWVWE